MLEPDPRNTSTGLVQSPDYFPLFLPYFHRQPASTPTEARTLVEDLAMPNVSQNMTL
jgi:hypothetical protein